MSPDCNPIYLQVYTCHISAYQLTELQHRLEVRTRPVILTQPEEVLVVREGSPASLRCRAVSGITRLTRPPGDYLLTSLTLMKLNNFSLKMKTKLQAGRQCDSVCRDH